MTTHPILAGLETARKNWGWFLVLGILLVLIGTILIVSPIAGTFLSIFWIGCMLLGAAAFELISAFQSRNWGGFFLELAEAVLFALAGLFMLRHPVKASVLLTLMLAAYFLASGAFQLIAGIATPLANRIWVILSGIVGIILGVMIMNDFIKPDDKPETVLMWIGLFVGIDLIFRGWAWIMFAMAAKRIPLAPA